MSLDLKFTRGERSLVTIVMAIALLGLVNWGTWQGSLFGLDAKQIAIVAFIPLALVLYYVLQRPDSEKSE